MSEIKTNHTKKSRAAYLRDNIIALYRGVKINENNNVVSLPLYFSLYLCSTFYYYS